MTVAQNENGAHCLLPMNNIIIYVDEGDVIYSDSHG